MVAGQRGDDASGRGRPPPQELFEDAGSRNLFTREIWMQCQFALGAIDALQRRPLGLDAYPPIEAFLIAAANLSKLLWGTDRRVAERRRPVREALSVGDESPLRGRELRNHFEHWDERVEAWIMTRAANDMFVGRSIAGQGQSREQPLHAFAHFDEATMTVWFAGIPHQLEPIVHAVREIEARARPDWARLYDEGQCLPRRRGFGSFRGDDE